MGGNKPQPQAVLPRDPALDAIKQRAETDKITAIQSRVGTETEDLLRRFGARVALSGANVGGAPVTLTEPSFGGGRL